MPRKRKTRKKEPKPDSQKKTPPTSTKMAFPEESYGLSLLQGFMRSDEDMVAVAYRIPTGQIGREDIVRIYKSKAMTALQQAARRRGYMVSVQHIEFKALTLGDETVIKAFALLRNASRTRDGKPVVEKRQDDPFGWEVKE